MNEETHDHHEPGMESPEPKEMPGVEGEDSGPNPPEGSPEPDTNPEDSEKDGEIDWSLYGDSSSVIDIQVIASGFEVTLLEDDRKPHENLFAYINQVLTDTTKSDLQKLGDGREVLRNFIPQHDKLRNGVEAAFTVWAFEIGQSLNIMKDLAKKTGHKWEEWADKHIKFIKKRTRQEYMLMASRPDARPYCFMDKQKLMLLIGPTKKFGGTDPIGAFLQKHGITLDLQEEHSYLEFKTLVDTAIAMEKIEELKIPGIERRKVHALVQLGVKMEGEILNDLKIVHDSGGDANNYLDGLHRSGGKSDKALEPKKKLEHFNNLAEKLKGTMNFLLEDQNQDLIREIDVSSLRTLMEILGKLARTLNIT